MAFAHPPHPTMPRNVMRYTVIDPRGTVSFVAPIESLKPLVAACSHRPASVSELLRAVRPYDDQLADEVTSGLAIFDEHVTNDSSERLHEMLDAAPDRTGAVFRVMDERSRQESMRAVRGGLVLFNLKAQRIIQVHNNLVRVRRRDRGRVRAS